MTRFGKALLGAVLALACGAAQATGIVPLSGSQQFDKDSSPPAFLNGGKLYVYQPGTTTCAAIFSDFALTSALPCPIILNVAGRIPAIYAADGSVRLRLLNSANLLQYDEDNVAIVTAAATSGGSTPIPDSTQIFGTRDIKIRFDDQPLPGYVRLNGRTIGSGSSGATERANTDAQSLFLQLWPFANVSVVAGKGASAAADWAANKQLILPDMAGRLLGAMDDLGAGPAGRITTATISGPTVVGAAGGTETKTLSQANLPSGVTLTTTISAGQGSHQHVADALPGALYIENVGAGGSFASNGAGPAWSQAAATALATLPSMSGTTPLGGSGTAHGIMPPVMLLMFHIKL